MAVEPDNRRVQQVVEWGCRMMKRHSSDKMSWVNSGDKTNPVVWAWLLFCIWKSWCVPVKRNILGAGRRVCVRRALAVCKQVVVLLLY